jgi:hypothetical protein
MSRHIYKYRTTEVAMGYDRPLDYVFCTVERQGRMVYSNLSDPVAGTACQSVDYYRFVLERLGITVPEAMFAAVAEDQKTKAGNIIVEYGGEDDDDHDPHDFALFPSRPRRNR